MTNDVQNLGALWSVSCGSSSCGSFSLIQTPSGAPTVYTAPSSVPPGGTVTITATSAANKSLAVNAVITIAAAPISVSLTPPVSPLQVGATGTASATVSNDSTNAGVNWSVSCASSSCGTFSPTHTASGASTVYTAPTAVPTGGTVTITATSAADNTKSQSASLTITAGSGPLSISFTTAPPSALQANAQASVIATVVNDSSNDGVNWSLTCGTGNTACGSLAFTHTVSGGANTFTAPASPPSGGTVTIIATAAATATASTPTSVSSTVAISSVGQAGLLIGQFAFYLAGTDSKGFYTEAGSVTLDGKGNVTGGEEDFADTASVHPTASSSLPGATPSVSMVAEPWTDQHGTTPASVSAGVETLSFVVVSSSRARVIEFDTSATSIGSLDLQTASSFSQISIAGGYSFAFAGVDLTKSSAAMDLGGVLTADGKGNFSSITEDLETMRWTRAPLHLKEYLHGARRQRPGHGGARFGHVRLLRGEFWSVALYRDRRQRTFGRPGLRARHRNLFECILFGKLHTFCGSGEDFHGRRARSRRPAHERRQGQHHRSNGGLQQRRRRDEWLTYRHLLGRDKRSWDSNAGPGACRRRQSLPVCVLPDRKQRHPAV